MMDKESLRQFYPLNLLSSGGLEALGRGISVLEYRDEDYVYRLGEELTDLLYVLEGSVQVMDIENKTNEVISGAKGKPGKPFTHDVPAGAVALARPQSRILKVDFRLLQQLLEREPEAVSAVRPGRRPEPDEAPPASAPSEPEYLELPEETDKDIQLLLPAGQSFARKNRTAAKPGAKSAKPDGKKEQPESAPSSAASKRLERAAAETPAKNRRKSVSEMLSDLKVILNSDIRLEPRTRRVESQETEQASKSVPAVTLYEDTGPLPPPPKPRRMSMTELLSGAREILYSDIRLEPRRKPGSEQEETAAPALKELSEAEFRDVEAREYLRAMSLFREEKWESAHAAFKALYAANPRTNLYRSYVNRCQANLGRSANPG